MPDDATKIISPEDPIFAAATRLSTALKEEIFKLKHVDELDNFEKRTKSLITMSKAVHTFNEFVRQLKLNAKDDDGSIGSPDEFRQELARKIKALVKK